MKHFFGYIFLLFVTYSCVEYPEYPDVPRVEYLYATPYYSDDGLGNLDKNVELHFMLYDGDGDIGDRNVDSNKNDFFSEFFVKNNGKFVSLNSIIADTSNYIIPQLRENGNTKFIKAEVTVDIPHSAGFPYDTLYIQFYVIDRADNKSNIDTTDIIIFPKITK